ncbi:MAG TPA: tetratricopeptide repeat protein [Planctomycetota bacterium]|nr:tetratricopeptide repeat protein [Planctomycetota bacterium]
MSRRERLGLIAVLSGAFAVRLLLILSLRGQPYFETPIVDSAAYDSWASEIARGNFWGDRAFYQDPLYPYGLGLFYKILGRNLLWVRIVQALLGTAGLWMLFEAARRSFDYPTAMAALVLGALYKTFIFYDAALLKEFLGVIAVEGALLAWSLDKSWKWAAFGTALGLGVLVRANLLLLVVATALFLFVTRERKSAGLVVAGAVLCILPVTIRNAVVAHDFVLTTSQFGPNLYTGNNPENTTGRYQPPSFLIAGGPEFEESGFRAEAERIEGRPLKASEVDRFWRSRAIDYIFSHGGTFLGVTLRRLLMLTNAFEVPDNYNIPFMARFTWVLNAPLFTFGYFVAPLAAAGLWLSWADRRRLALLYLLLGTYVASILFFFVFDRYRLPILPLLMLFAAHAVVTAVRTRSVPKPAWIVFLATLVLVNIPLPASIGGYRDFRTAHYNLGVYYAGQERPAEAAAEFESAARLQPAFLQNPTFVWKLAQAYEAAGQAPQALEHYREAVRLDPSSAEAAARTGRLYFQEGMYERASEFLAEALRRDPRFPDAAGTLAESLRRQRRFDAALESLEGPVDRAPKDWALRLKRAEIYADVAMWKEALGAAEETLALRPAQPDAVRIRDAARQKLR